MADTTTVMALPFPEGSDANDVPADMQALAERLDEAPGIESLTSAQIAALTAGQKPAGRVVYNSTTSKLQVSNGTTFANIDAAALLLAGGTLSGALAMGANKITGLAAASANGDAVRYEQLVATDASVTALGTWQDWTPTITQGSAVSKTVTVARYTQIGDTIHAYAKLAITGSGTASNTITMSLPATAAGTGYGGGSWWHFDTGAVNRTGFTDLQSASLLRFFVTDDGNPYGSISPTLASGDIFTVSFTYEAA